MSGTEAAAAAPSVTVSVRYLSAVREKSGTRRDELCLPSGSTLGALAEWVKTNRGIALPTPSVMTTLNGHGWSQLPSGLATELHDGDEVALFPLLSGG
jgi:molybdopterin converting factor small subunit